VGLESINDLIEDLKTTLGG